MKKLILVIATALIGLSANAQMGIVAGVTSTSNTIKEAYANARDITQYHVGVAYKLDFGLLAVQPAIIYNVKGTRIEDAVTNGTAFSADFKTGYLEIPVQIQAGMNVLGLRPYVFAEPFLGYAITNEFSEQVLGVTLDSSTGWDNIKDRFEYGVGLGAGVEIFDMLQLSVRYFWNLGQVYSGSAISVADMATSIQNSKANGIMASLAVFF